MRQGVVKIRPAKVLKNFAKLWANWGTNTRYCPLSYHTDQELSCVSDKSTKDTKMGEFTEKAKGAANEVAGNTKQVVGDATNNASLKSEGHAQEAKGEAQNLKGEVEGKLGNKV